MVSVSVHMCAYNSVMSEKELMGNQNETGKEDGNAISVRLVSAPGKGPRTEGGRFYKTRPGRSVCRAEEKPQFRPMFPLSYACGCCCWAFERVTGGGGAQKRSHGQRIIIAPINLLSVVS